MTPKGKSDLLIHEGGFRLKPYQDTEGVMTIGAGHNLEEGISQRVAEILFEEDLQRAHEDAVAVVGEEEFQFLSRARKDVIENMAFNLGRGRLASFSRMLMALRRGDYGMAAREMLDSRWARQVGGRASYLSEVMRRGDYSNYQGQEGVGGIPLTD